MKNYTEEDVSVLINATITETISGFMEFLKEETIIVDKSTKEVLPNTELTIKSETKDLIKKYILPRLEKYRITKY